MAYELTRDNADTLYLKMDGFMSMDDFVAINARINQEIIESKEQMVLIVDMVNGRVTPYEIEAIKATQTYLNSYQISKLFVVGSNKTNRLAMLLLFNLCRPKLQFCDSLEQLQHFL